MFSQIAISTILLLVWVSSSPYAHAQDYAQVACGGRPNMANGCRPVVTDTVLKTDLYGVRCCSSAPFPHAKKQAQCDVWAIARTPTVTCNTAATYEEALAHCNNLGAERLCTVDELLNKCAKSTGCGLNKKLVWSLPSTASPTQSPVSLPEPLTASPTKAPVVLPGPLTASPTSSPVSLPTIFQSIHALHVQGQNHAQILAVLGLKGIA
eukprot:CAMPEP_0203667254 /NCGR_PEP_ID=MMETSP0090-20130426/4139_1 /ASSEMBLY_ACC=CAM_ASM_001088 /TAXON_ID=426623 /ORGANISM="Chaetoceros affinis, Strain CCMP159" /LENGTH=208 /DNA_ID=CAMNT_0050531367 /DNA_START=53 /DNA_END=680 /DNA_ORIENTATION=+